MVQRIGQLFGVSVMAGVLVAAMILPAVGGLGLTARDVATGFLNMPSELETLTPPQRSIIYDSEGGEIAQVYDRNRELIELEDMSPILQEAIIAIEDSRFYEHGGIDIQGTFRAAIRTLRGDTQGGSSITQQYVKNVLVESATSREEVEDAQAETLARKIRELRYAVTLEQELTKDEILEGYLNIAYFGDGAYGAESASQHFFSVSADELELDEAATLAGAVRFPFQYNPRLNPDEAVDRRNTVLDRMAENEMITWEEAEETKEADLDLDAADMPDNGCVPSDAPFFCDYVINHITNSEEFGEDEEERDRWLKTAGLEIHTTLDPDMQEAAQDAVDKWVPRDNESRKVAAEVLVEPGTGEIRAMAQSRDYGPDEDELGVTSINFTTDYDNGGSTGFQAGSTFKTVTLAAALDQGLGFGTSFDSPGSMTITGQTNCEGGTLAPWSVSNAGESDSGGHNMISGTKGSVNTYFAQLQRRVGLCDVIEMAETLGLERADGTSFDNPNTQANNSFTLGSEEVSPMRVANAYAVFASGGQLCEPQPFTEIYDSVKDETLEFDSDCEQVIDEDVAAGVSYILSQTFKGGTTNGLDIGRPAAAKTGSTDGTAAAWFAGFTPNLSGAVFVGDPRGPQEYPLRNVNIGGRYYGQVYGATIPGPIWQETFREAVEKIPEESFPSAPSRFGSTSSQPSGGGSDTQTAAAGGVPDVVGQTEEAAVAALDDAGYNVNVSGSPISSAEPAGSVAAVNPDPGTSLPSGATVNLFLSNGEGGADGALNDHGQPAIWPGSTRDPDHGEA
ncbi:penicillin-binding protein [Spiractinospora alimapuensis]|uniref:penicillin-binding protein n=1 Tax=Spiractinospora alimapuensis TaxID=2820884 RepID=UPI001F35ECB8|nr:penicillin-binding protein [Spiractinospora alimapuensis]QVQ54945.1 penicillin-binding protein [Spiractinospora alimapuensis]